MTLREAKGNMYDFLTHTYNIIKGRCPHNCKYCYMKIFPQGNIRLDEKALEIDLGQNRFIFVGSSCDMFADKIPEEWIIKVLEKLKKHSTNKYLFQSKNPLRMFNTEEKIPKNSIIGTTIETNRQYKEMGETPSIKERIYFMKKLKDIGYKTMITIEPIMDFDTKEFVELLKYANPTWINIGADSKGHKLPEPSKTKILELVEEVKKFTEIKKKHNIKRLIGG